MLLESELEQRLKDVLGNVGVPVTCFWDPKTQSAVHLIPRTALAIRAAPRSHELYDTEDVTVAITVNLNVAIDDETVCPQLTTVWSHVSTALMGVVSCGGNYAAFTVTNDNYTFTCNYAAMESIGDCGFDSQAQVWWASATLTLRGINKRLPPTGETDSGDNTEEETEGANGSGDDPTPTPPGGIE